MEVKGLEITKLKGGDLCVNAGEEGYERKLSRGRKVMYDVIGENGRIKGKRRRREEEEDETNHDVY